MAAKNPFLTALERYQQRAGAGGALQQELALRTELEDLVSIQEARSLARGTDISQFADVSGDIADTQKRLQDLEQNRQAGASKALLSKLTTLSTQGEISRRISRQASLSSTYTQSLRRVGIPTGRLESDYVNQMSNIAELGDELKAMAGNINDPGTLAQYKAKVAQMTQLESAAALTRTTLRTQHSMGLDPRGIVGGAQTAASRIGGMVGRFDIEARARGGEFGSLSEESSRLADMFRTLQISLENYTEAQDGSMEAQEAAGQRLKSITEEISEQEGIVAAVRRGEGGGGKFGRAGQILGIANNVLRMGTDIYSALEISQPLQLMENQTRFANMANRQYENVGSMLEGNQMAFLKTVQMDSFRRALTDQFFGKQQTMVGLGIAGNALEAGITIGTGFATGGLAGTVIGSEGLGAAGQVVTGGVDLYKGVTAGRAAADAAQRVEAFFEALQGIPARQFQAYEDMTRGAYMAGTGFGGRSNTVMKSLLDLSKGGFVDQAARANISPMELLELTSLAGQTIGGVDFDRASILSAGRAEQRGQLSKTQYMSMLGQLTDIGGRDRNLEETLKKAVTVGMDDSKNISRMVSATVSLSEGGALQGFNVSQAMSELLMRGVGGIRGTDLNMSQKTKMAASAAENLDRMYKMGGTDIFGLQEYSKLAAIFPEASYEQTIALEEAGNASVSMFRSLLNAEKGSTAYNQAMGSLERSGFASLVKSAKTGEIDRDRLRRILGTKSEVVTARALGIAPSMGAEKASMIAQFVATGDEAFLGGLTPQELDVARVQFRRAGLGEFFMAAAMMGGRDPSGANLTPAAGDLRSSVFRKIQSKAAFDYNEMSRGNQKLEELFGIKEDVVSMPADPSGMDWEEFNKTFMSEAERRGERQRKLFQQQGDILQTAAKYPETLDLEKQRKDIAESRAPEALSFEKQSKDFKDGVIVFEEGVKKFNEVVKTMEKGASSRWDPTTAGSEKANKEYQQYLLNRHGITQY